MHEKTIRDVIHLVTLQPSARWSRGPCLSVTFPGARLWSCWSLIPWAWFLRHIRFVNEQREANLRRDLVHGHLKRQWQETTQPCGQRVEYGSQKQGNAGERDHDDNSAEWRAHVTGRTFWGRICVRRRRISLNVAVTRSFSCQKRTKRGSGLAPRSLYSFCFILPDYSGFQDLGCTSAPYKVAACPSAHICKSSLRPSRCCLGKNSIFSCAPWGWPFFGIYSFVAPLLTGFLPSCFCPLVLSGVSLFHCLLPSSVFRSHSQSTPTFLIRKHCVSTPSGAAAFLHFQKINK